jgi:hypothetical protein
MNTYLVEEQETLDGSSFFFDALPVDIELILIVENSRYQSLKTYDQDHKREVEFNLDSRGFIRRPRRTRRVLRFLGIMRLIT